MFALTAVQPTCQVSGTEPARLVVGIQVGGMGKGVVGCSGLPSLPRTGPQIVKYAGVIRLPTGQTLELDEGRRAEVAFLTPRSGPEQDGYKD